MKTLYDLADVVRWVWYYKVDIKKATTKYTHDGGATFIEYTLEYKDEN